MTARYIVADVFDGLAQLPDDSVDLVFSSPPFLALRSYLPADHPDKAREIGSEATPAAFLDRLLDVVEACDRVLAPHGSLVFELGDTYAGGGSTDPRIAEDGSTRKGDARIVLADGRTIQGNGASNGKERKGDGWPLDKSLCGIPTLFAWSLAYGRNLLRPERVTPRWRVRNLVAWCRPNPPVGALGDKFRPATSYLTVACKSRDRYFDLDAVREAPSPNTHPRTARGVESRPNDCKTSPDGNRGTLAIQHASAGAPPLDWWVIPTEPYEGAHYATFPRQLVVKPIKAMCPQRVCTVCGEPSRRIVEAFTLDSYRSSTRPQTMKAVALADEHGLTDKHIAAIRAFGTSDAGKATVLNTGNGHNSDRVKRLAAEAKAVLGGYFREFVMTTEAERVSGWSDCGHDAYRVGCVLDPFAGSGTTLAVSTGHGRDAIGIDLDERNAELALERVGPMFLNVELPSVVDVPTGTAL